MQFSLIPLSTPPVLVREEHIKTAPEGPLNHEWRDCVRPQETPQENPTSSSRAIGVMATKSKKENRRMSDEMKVMICVSANVALIVSFSALLVVCCRCGCARDNSLTTNPKFGVSHYPADPQTVTTSYPRIFALFLSPNLSWLFGGIPGR